MKKRDEILDKYKWDLSAYIKDEKMLENEFDYLKSNVKKFSSFYNKFGDKNVLLEYFQFSKEFDMRYSRLASYIFHSLDTDTSNTKFLNLSSRFEFLTNDISKATSYIEPQMLSLDEKYLKSLLNDKAFDDYSRIIESIIKNKPHKISEADSALLSKMSMFLGSTEEIFSTLTNGEIKFEDVVGKDGKKYAVNESDYGKLMTNLDRDVRKGALKSLMQGYGDKNRTITSMYLNDIKKDVFFARLSNFGSVKESELFDEEVSPFVYDKLIENINKNLDIIYDYVEAKSRIFKIKDIAYYDIMLPLNNQATYSVEEAKKMVIESTKPLGEEYHNLVVKKFEDKIIDYLPNENKQTGAYSSGCYGCPSIILMNFVDDLKSVYTLAHEMGHTMHSEFSNRNQPFEKSNYKIFVAEVASTVNELLLYNYLLKSASKEETKSLVFDLMDEVRSTIFRQTMFAEFEDWVHTQIENEKPLNYEDLNNYYYNLNKKYYGEKLILPEELKFEWSRIPHFYNAFYVYKYATGFISALCIVENILSDSNYYKKYINFLKSGCSKGVIDLLKEIDVDLTTDEPYLRAFKYIKEQLSLINS